MREKLLLFFSPEDSQRLLAALDTMRGLEWQGGNFVESGEYQRMLDDARWQIERYSRPAPTLLTQEEIDANERNWFSFLAKQFGIVESVPMPEPGQSVEDKILFRQIQQLDGGNSARLPEAEITPQGISWSGEPVEPLERLAGDDQC